VSTLVAVVSDRGRPPDTVSYVLREARDAAGFEPVTVRFLVPVGDGPDGLRRPAASALADRIAEVVAREPRGRLTVGTQVVTIAGGTPDARLDSLVQALPAEATVVVSMPELAEFEPSGVAAALARASRGSVGVERAPVGRRIVRPPVALPRTSRRVVATFAVSLAFYLALGDPTKPFDLVTGVASAAVVAGLLSRVAFERDPSLASVRRLLRAVVFVPSLLLAVVRANLGMAVVVLDPRLPIDPQMVRIPAPEGRLARALLANSITLTPGTLTVEVTDDELVVHTLTDRTRADLLSGDLAWAVSYVMTGERRPSDSRPGHPEANAAPEGAD
jgi:multicomponent Na+:H+ antiporter subunit E